MCTLKGSVSVGKATTVGLLWVNGPVLVLLFGPPYLALSSHWMVLPWFGGGFVLAWLWWSLMIPRWRLWAYERVEDIPALKESAVSAGLTWPDGSVFSRTELKSRRQALRERELEPPEVENSEEDSEGDSPTR